MLALHRDLYEHFLNKVEHEEHRSHSWGEYYDMYRPVVSAEILSTAVARYPILQPLYTESTVIQPLGSHIDEPLGTVRIKLDVVKTGIERVTIRTNWLDNALTIDKQFVFLSTGYTYRITNGKIIRTLYTIEECMNPRSVLLDTIDPFNDRWLGVTFLTHFEFKYTEGRWWFREVDRDDSMLGRYHTPSLVQLNYTKADEAKILADLRKGSVN